MLHVEPRLFRVHAAVSILVYGWYLRPATSPFQTTPPDSGAATSCGTCHSYTATRQANASFDLASDITFCSHRMSRGGGGGLAGRVCVLM
jgi:hypothetical protein